MFAHLLFRARSQIYLEPYLYIEYSDRRNWSLTPPAVQTSLALGNNYYIIYVTQYPKSIRFGQPYEHHQADQVPESQDQSDVDEALMGHRL